MWQEGSDILDDFIWREPADHLAVFAMGVVVASTPIVAAPAFILRYIVDTNAEARVVVTSPELDV